MDSVCDWIAHFENWPKSAPICAHAEGRTTAAVILLASLHDRQLHVCHVAILHQKLFDLIPKEVEQMIQVTFWVGNYINVE